MINASYPNLIDVISASIGHPTEDKIKHVLSKYNDNNYHLIGAFLNDLLIGVIGFTVNDITCVIHHIAVLSEYRLKNIGSKLISQIRNHFLIKHISAETDQDAVEFYIKCGFKCNKVNADYANRYKCELNICSDQRE